jgi:S-adenosylmethionine hydrolase
MTKRPIITLLTDFGLADHYVAAMKGVILGICPAATLVDISHEIKAFGIMEAAFVLGQAYPCFPAGTIHLAVVDPGVGSARRPLLLEAHGQRFVAPDNGVLTSPIDSDPRYKAREISAVSYYRQPVSNTFHGRDIFAPVAAHVAAGLPAARIGKRISDPVRLDLPTPGQKVETGVLRGHILYVDRFGNLITSFRASDAPEIIRGPFEIALENTVVQSRYEAVYSHAPKGSIFLVTGSSGYLEVSINQGNAALETGATAGSAVVLRLQAGGVLFG